MKHLFGRSALVAAALLASGLTISAAHAADATPSPTPTATPDNVTPARLELAKKILAAVGLKESIDKIVPSMLGQLQGQLSQMHPEMAKPLHETLVSLLPEFDSGEEGVFNDTAHVLAAKLDEQDLQQTFAYFDSTAGRRYTGSQAAVLEELGVSGGVWREKLTKVMVDRTREEMKKKGFSF